LNYFEENINLYLGQFKELRKYYPNLKDQMESDNLFLRGKICFKEDFDTGFTICDCYLVEIAFSPNYPYDLPAVKEIGGKIKSDYPHFNKDGTRTLCLGTNVDLWLLFRKTRTIFNFVHNLLVPSLYAHGYWKRKGVMPSWGDRHHGTPGVIQSYSEIFGLSDAEILLKLLKVIIDGDYKGNSQCPCESKRVLNECHGKDIFRLWHVPWNYIVRDYDAIKVFTEHRRKKVDYLFL